MTEYIEKWSVVNRLIDLENELQRHKPFHGFKHAMYRKICEAEIAIGKMPAADVAPVRHGRWLYHTLIDKDSGKTKGAFEKMGMTLERAIGLASEWADGHVNTLREGEAEAYHKLCLELLLEKREDTE